MEGVRAGADARTRLELALVKAARPETDGSTRALLARIERLERGARAPLRAGPLAERPPAAAAMRRRQQTEAPPAATPPEVEPSGCPQAEWRHVPDPDAALEPHAAAVAAARGAWDGAGAAAGAGHGTGAAGHRVDLCAVAGGGGPGAQRERADRRR